MPERNIFRWVSGRGWLVLSGGPDVNSDVRSMALARSAADGGVAYVSTGGGADTAEHALEDMEDLGAPSGYLVDVASEDDQTVIARLTEASVVVIESHGSAEAVRSSLLGAAAEGLQAAFANGAVILAEGPSAMVFGSWVVRDNGELVNGLEWVEGGLFAPGVNAAAAWARDVLTAQALAYVVGIGVGSALALGPDGQVEIWGKGDVTVALGQNFTSGAGETEA